MSAPRLSEVARLATLHDGKEQSDMKRAGQTSGDLEMCETGREDGSGGDAGRGVDPRDPSVLDVRVAGWGVVRDSGLAVHCSLGETEGETVWSHRPSDPNGGWSKPP